eukprot:4728476-Prymnesium_polylepis.1
MSRHLLKGQTMGDVETYRRSRGDLFARSAPTMGGRRRLRPEEKLAALPLVCRVRGGVFTVGWPRPPAAQLQPSGKSWAAPRHHLSGSSQAYESTTVPAANHTLHFPRYLQAASILR